MLISVKDTYTEKSALLPSTARRPASRVCVLVWIWLLCLLALTPLLYTSSLLLDDHASRKDHDAIQWEPCHVGEFECSHVRVPFDWQNSSRFGSDSFTLPIIRLRANSSASRLGSVLTNPGGPGSSGVDWVLRAGLRMRFHLQGRYDIVGWDPRGVNGSHPAVNCFHSPEDELSFYNAHEAFYLNLPANLTLLDEPSVEWDLRRQARDFKAAIEALAGSCKRKVGDALAWMGTEATVHDIDYIAELLDGNQPINYWGFSYGTVIGQQLIQILPAARLGRIILDGVVSAPIWSNYSDIGYEKKGFASVNDVLLSFAEQCTSSSACPLSQTYKSGSSLMDRIDEEINKLYMHPQAVSNAGYPAVITASAFRSYVFLQLYGVSKWPAFASVLNATFHDDYEPLAEAIKIRLDGKPGFKNTNFVDLSIFPIYCTDTRPFDKSHPPPTLDQRVQLVKSSLQTYSPRNGDGFIWSLYCDSWKNSLEPRQSRYNGGYAMANNTLTTPILLMSNTYDPVTPLSSALEANQELGNNARLIQQIGGVGHCAESMLSACAAERLAAYMINGTVQTAKHALCQVEDRDVFFSEGSAYALSDSWI